MLFLYFRFKYCFFIFYYYLTIIYLDFFTTSWVYVVTNALGATPHRSRRAHFTISVSPAASAAEERYVLFTCIGGTTSCATVLNISVLRKVSRDTGWFSKPGGKQNLLKIGMTGFVGFFIFTSRIIGHESVVNFKISTLHLVKLSQEIMYLKTILIEKFWLFD